MGFRWLADYSRCSDDTGNQSAHTAKQHRVYDDSDHYDLPLDSAPNQELRPKGIGGL
jgi:hypothetical protein